MNRVIFVGPLPPPTNGFSTINAKMFEILAKYAVVTLVDRAAKSHSRHVTVFSLLYLVQSFWSWVTFALKCVLFYGKARLYLGLSGGLGQSIDALYLMTAALCRFPTYIHHHSFAYLNEKSRLTEICFGLTPQAIHIVLCPTMKQRLIDRYGVDAERVVVLSNAAFIERLNHSSIDEANEQPNDDCVDHTVVIGFLSNITREKGIFEFFELYGRLVASGLNVIGRIAGPVDPSIHSDFITQMKLHPNLEYVGAVYGADKARFYARIDILVFPTKYANEAEPLVLYEAASNGVFVVAKARGCIFEMLSVEQGCVCGDGEDFVEAALAAISGQMHRIGPDRAGHRMKITYEYDDIAARSAESLRTLIKRIAL